MSNNDLIQVAQLPVIIQHLEAMSSEIQAKTQQAMTLAVSPETLADVRKVRADLNKDKAELEDSRKAVKQAIMAPYNEFEDIYRKLIAIPFAEADKDLGSKIFEVEQGIIGACIEELKAYFAELVVAENIEWLTWDRLNIRVTLTDAKQKSHKKLRDQIRDSVTMKANAVKAIATTENAAEIMAEYKQCLSTEQAIRTVADRHKRIENEAKARQEWEARQAADQQVVEKVDAVAPPVAAPAPVVAPVEDTKIYTCKFTVHATKAQLKKLKDFLNMEGIRYE